MDNHITIPLAGDDCAIFAVRLKPEGMASGHKSTVTLVTPHGSANITKILVKEVRRLRSEANSSK